MKIAGLFPFLLLAACTTTQPYAPVSDPRYSAMGEEPFWLLNIGDDRIVLRMAGTDTDAVWPRTLPRTQGNVTRWESGDGTAVIAIESRPGPCTNGRGEAYEDHVLVRLSGREMSGCGGPLIGRRN